MRRSGHGDTSERGPLPDRNDCNPAILGRLNPNAEAEPSTFRPTTDGDDVGMVASSRVVLSVELAVVREGVFCT